MTTITPERDKMYETMLKELQDLRFKTTQGYTYEQIMRLANVSQITFSIIQTEYLRHQEISALEQTSMNQEQETINSSIKKATWTMAAVAFAQLIVIILELFLKSK